MDKAALRIRLRNIFREVFDDPSMAISDETSPETLLEWDSVAQVKLVIMAEEEFDITLELGEVSKIKCVADFIEAINRHLP